MAVRPTYPGVYIEELPSGVRTITGVATSITAFIGYTARGLDDKAERVLSFADFVRKFGGLAADSELSYAVQHFFDNGGSEAYVVRVPKTDSERAEITAEDDVGGGAAAALEFTARSKGAWTNDIIIDLDYVGVSDSDSFNLTITDTGTGDVETFKDVTMKDTERNFVELAVNDEDTGSRMVSVKVGSGSPDRPAQSGTVGGDIDLAVAPFNLTASDKTYEVKITSDLPTVGPIIDVTIEVFEEDDPIPTSVLGLCRQLERRANEALANEKPGARVRCVPSDSGEGIRVYADFDQAQIPNSRDAVISFNPGAANSLLSKLELNNATENVGRYWLGKGRNVAAQTGAVDGSDGTGLPSAKELIGNPAVPDGMYALDKVDIFNILCIPDATRAKANDPSTQDIDDPGINSIYNKAMAYGLDRRAFLVVDSPPDVDDLDSATTWISSRLSVSDKKSGAVYFPRLRMPDPLNEFKLRTFAPSGVVAGLYARTDTERGVWKAPAGTEARLVGVSAPVYKLTDEENGVLNPLGLNCFRNFPIYRNVAWGARTLLGADAQASEWKYIPVRRLALFIEESLYRGTQWVVFEPNDEPLWSQIRLNVVAFMHNLFRQGAFQGSTPREAYLVKCDKETTTQNDIDLGIVNILVGFAPLKPAEFVFIKIQQLAGQVEA